MPVHQSDLVNLIPLFEKTRNALMAKVMEMKIFDVKSLLGPREDRSNGIDSYRKYP
jgi:hypothetical protein